MAITKPPVLPPWADAATPETDIVQPTNEEISDGWPSSTTPPSRQRWNWVLNFCANAVRYFSRRGLADWDSAETYQLDDIVRGDHGLLCRSLQNNNTNRLPSAVLSSWWGPINAVTPASGDNSTKIATTAYVQSSITGKANTTGSYPGLTVGTAAQAAQAAVAASANSVPWSGVTGRPATVGGYGITDAITTGNIAFQSVSYANSAGRAYPLRWDGNEFRVNWSGQGGQPNWLLGSTDGTNWYVYNPSNFSVNYATNAANATTQPFGTSNTSIATTAFACPGFSHGGNGYDVLPSGLILQWGTTGSIGGGGSQFVTFPVSFPAICFVAVTESNTGGGTAQSESYSSPPGTAGFTKVNSGNVSRVYRWFAVGR